MARTQNDVYANMASAQVTLTDGDIEFVELQTGISLGQGTGILIDSISYFFGGQEGNLADTKNVAIGWSTSNALTAINNINDRRVIHFMQTVRHDYGTAGNAGFFSDPKVYEFAPPIIVAAPRLYLAASVSASSGMDGDTLKSRFSFRYVNLTDKEYLEIAETFILVG